MFCSNCGYELKKGAKFCSKCGAQILSPGENQVERPVQTESGAPCADYDIAETSDAEPAVSDPVTSSEQPKKKKKILTAVIIIILAAAVAAVVFFVWNGGGSEKQFQSHMEAGQTYLEEQAYEEAVDEFEAAIEIQSEAVEPYRLMAQAYIGLDDSESVEATYDTIRGIIVTHYETSEENELLEDSKALYVDAINYYGEQEDADAVEELVDEIVPMLTEESDVEEIEELSEQWISQIEEENIEDTEGEETGNDIDAGEAPTEETVIEMLNMFSYWAVFVNDYSGIIDANKAIEIAAFAIDQTGEYISMNTDGVFIKREEVENGSGLSENAVWCYPLPSDVHEEYLRNLFGAQYQLADYNAPEDSGYILQDYNGQLYLVEGDYGNVDVENISVMSITKSTGGDAEYIITAQYTTIEGMENNFIKIEYHFVEDDTSDYGYVITWIEML